MITSGLGTKFCQLIENMYENASSCIKLGTMLGTPFSSKVGLRQGDPLSPLLFNLFMADLIFAFTTKCSPLPYTILQSLQSSSRTISATSLPRRLALGRPSNVPSNIAQPIGSKSTFKNPAIRFLMTPSTIGRTLSFASKPSNTIPVLAT